MNLFRKTYRCLRNFVDRGLNIDTNVYLIPNVENYFKSCIDFVTSDFNIPMQFDFFFNLLNPVKLQFIAVYL